VNEIRQVAKNVPHALVRIPIISPPLRTEKTSFPHESPKKNSTDFISERFLRGGPLAPF